MILDILGIGEFFYKVIIGLVTGIYQIVNFTYQIFLCLAETNIFSQDQYEQLTEKVYVILGVVMLFIMAYNILMLIVDPDRKDNEFSIDKMLKNIVISFIMIVLCPSVFTFAFDVQESVLNSGLITKFFNDGSSQDNAGDIRAGGRTMAINTFIAFFNASSGSPENMMNETGMGTYSYVDATGKTYTLECSDDDFLADNAKHCSLQDALDYAEQTGDFSVFKAFAKNVLESEISFNVLISLVAAIYLVYVIVSFCFDMAVRVIKLAFYQIIAPIAITCRILPKKDDIYKNWLKATTQTFLAVFIRVLIMNMGVYLINVFIKSDFFGHSCENCDPGVSIIAYAFIILGIVTFIKQAPKLLDDVFGLGSDVSLGIKDKMKDVTSLGGKAVGLGMGAAGFIGGTVQGKGNPLAGVRAARENYKNKNLSGVQSEINRRHEKEAALAKGATGKDIAIDRLRSRLGLASLQAKTDYEIDDDKTYEVIDENGNRVKMTAKKSAELAAIKEQNATDMARLNEEIRQVQIFQSQAKKFTGNRGDIKAEALDKIREGDSKFEESFVDASGRALFTGNYAAMQSYLKQQIDAGTIAGDDIKRYTEQLKKAEDNMWKDYVNVIATGQKRNGVAVAGVSNGKIKTIYQQMQDDYAAGVLTDATGATISLAHTSGYDFVDDAYVQGNNTSNDITITVNGIERQKSAHSNQNSNIDRMTEQVEEQKRAQKQTTRYTSRSASSSYVDKTKGKGGS